MDGKRNTIQRQLILNAVRELNCHSTAEQVYELVVSKHPSISKGTVYRNLNLMAESGELMKVFAGGGSFRYDHNCHNHYHFICEKCEVVFDVDNYFEDIISKVSNPQAFEIKSHSITFFGICPICQSAIS